MSTGQILEGALEGASEGALEGALVVADIGATNARFALAGSEGVTSQRVYSSRDSGSGLELVARYLAEVEVLRPAAFCIALAGPIQGRSANLTNTDIGFSETQLEARFGAPARLINDFAAIACAVPVLEASGLAGVGRDADIGPLDPGGPGIKAVIGPGTGLGMAMLLPDADGWLVMPSQGGHCDLAATDPLEAEVLAILRRERDQVPWEACLSGPGLVALYRAVCDVWGCQPDRTKPEDVSAGVVAGDPVCHQTLEMFWGMLGCAAGNLALMSCARGGVLIGGGIVPKLLDLLDPGHFRRRFEQRGALQSFAHGVPTAVIVDPDVGLKGAARAFLGAVRFID
jgi:glucokinase